MKHFFLMTLFLSALSLTAQIPVEPDGGIGGAPEPHPDNLLFPRYDHVNLLVDDNGFALLLDEKVSNTGRVIQSTATIRAYDTKGDMVWEKAFTDRANHYILFTSLKENSLVLAFLDGSIWLEDNLDARPANGLVCLDTTTGSEKWRMDFSGDPRALAPANDGSWFLTYVDYNATGYTNRLANIGPAGTVRFDLQTKEEHWHFPIDPDEGGEREEAQSSAANLHRLMKANQSANSGSALSSGFKPYRR